MRSQWSRDSAQYVVDSIRYAHDHRVRDSISRTINTDSLYKLNRARLVAANPVPLEGERECEEARLSARFGAIPAEMAITRMEDTLWKRGEEAAVRKMEDRLHNMTVEEMGSIGVSQRKCGKITPMLKMVDGATLDMVGAAPVRPKAPPGQ
jgi:hypothetical protein